MPVNIESLKKTAIRELATFLGLMFCGLLILPLAIYMVGNSVFGEYGGTGFFAFYSTLHSAIRDVEGKKSCYRKFSMTAYPIST